MAAAATANEELQLILSLDDTDVDEIDQASPSIRQSTKSFTVNELVLVLERISSGMMKAEADLATAILMNMRLSGKNVLDCFVSSFVEALRQCNDRVQNVKNESIRAIKLEKEFSTLRNDQHSELFMSWKRLVAVAVGNSCQVDCSLVVFQHVLQHFWSCVTVKEEPDPVDVEPRSPTVNLHNKSTDAAEREAIRRHAGWAVKRARDIINLGKTVVSIKRSKDDSTVTEVTKKCLLGFFERLGKDQRQDSGQFLFIVTDVVLEFFIILHQEVQDFFKLGIEKDTVIQCLKHLSVSQHLRMEWKKVVGILCGEEEAASIFLLQQIVSMFVKSKQQIIREQLHLKPQKQSKSLRQTLSGSKKMS